MQIHRSLTTRVVQLGRFSGVVSWLKWKSHLSPQTSNRRNVPFWTFSGVLLISLVLYAPLNFSARRLSVILRWEFYRKTPPLKCFRLIRRRALRCDRNSTVIRSFRCTPQLQLQVPRSRCISGEQSTLIRISTPRTSGFLFDLIACWMQTEWNFISAFDWSIDWQFRIQVGYNHSSVYCQLFPITQLVNTQFHGECRRENVRSKFD